MRPLEGCSLRTAEYALVVLALVVCVFFSTYKLSESPGIWYDEGFHTQAAMNLAEHGRQELQIAPGTFFSSSVVTSGYPLIAPVALSYKLFGVGVLQGRAVMVLFIFALCIASFFFVRILFGTWYASWALLVLTTLPPLYGNGKSILGEVPGLLFLVLALIALKKLEDSQYRSLGWSALFGLFVGLTVAAHTTFVLFPIAILLTLVVRARTLRIPLPSFGVGAVCAIVPIALWICMQFAPSDSLSFLLSFYASPYSSDAVQSSGIIGLFTDTTPLYVLGAIALWGGSLYLRRKKAEAVKAAEVAAFIYCLVVMAAYLRLPSWYRYFFEAMVVGVLFLPYALSQLRETFAKRFFYVPYAVLVVLVAAQLYQLAAHSYVADYYHNNRTAVVSQALSKLPQVASVFVYDAPELVVLLPNKNYYQYIAPHRDYLVGKQELAHISDGDVDYVLLRTAAYNLHPGDFAKYAPYTTANRYTILKRRG